MSQVPRGIPEPTEIAGRYQVVQKLGAGAFGTVYKAKDKILGRMVAIKTIRMEGLAAAAAGVEEMVARFEREARLSAQLKHPNIVTIYDVGQSEGLSYLAMEFIDGVGLDRIIAQAGRLPVEPVASIGAQPCSGDSILASMAESRASCSFASRSTSSPASTTQSARSSTRRDGEAEKLPRRRTTHARTRP